MATAINPEEPMPTISTRRSGSFGSSHSEVNPHMHPSIINFALGKVNDAGGAHDHGEAQRDQTVDAADGKPADKQIYELESIKSYHQRRVVPGNPAVAHFFRLIMRAHDQTKPRICSMVVRPSRRMSAALLPG